MPFPRKFVFVFTSQPAPKVSCKRLVKFISGKRVSSGTQAGSLPYKQPLAFRVWVNRELAIVEFMHICHIICWRSQLYSQGTGTITWNDNLKPYCKIFVRSHFELTPPKFVLLTKITRKMNVFTRKSFEYKSLNLIFFIVLSFLHPANAKTFRVTVFYFKYCTSLNVPK
jgi:hypothetical protein